MASNGAGEQTIHGQESDVDSSAAKMAGTSEQEAELEAWFESSWTRLNAVPDSTDKYISTCAAIQQLQILVQEALDKRDQSQSQIDESFELSFRFDSLIKLMSTKQEQLFQGVVHFHQTELVRIGAGLDEADRKLSEQPRGQAYVDKQKQLHTLKYAREELSTYQTDLLQLVEAPQPHPLGHAHPQQQLLQQEQVPSPLLSPSEGTPSSPLLSSTSPVFTELKSLTGKAQMTSLRCQQLCQNFDDKLELLENELNSQSDKFVQELEDVEVWIQNAYAVLREEPAREIGGVYSQEEMDAEEEEVMSQRSQEVSGQSDTTSGAGGRGSQLRESVTTPDLFSSGEFGSLGSEGIVGSPDEVKGHDLSVDPDLSDDEYSRNVLDRVISPEPEGEGDASVDNKEYNVGFSVSTNESDEEDGTEVDKEVQFAMSPEPEEVEPPVFEGESIISQSTLKASADKAATAADTSVDKDEGDSVEGSTEHSEAVTQDTVETRSTSTSSKYSIPWVKSLGYLRLYHDENLDGEVVSPIAGYRQRRREVDSILAELEGILGQMPVQSQKVKRVMATTSFIISTASKEHAAELNNRLQWVKVQFDKLRERLKKRQIQLKFEKAEKDILESILETCQELKEQPDGVLLKHEMETKQGDLKDFIVDMEQYTQQKNAQLKELDASFEALKEVCPEKAELLQEGADTVVNLKKAYEDVARKVQEQEDFLVQSLESWDRFDKLCVKFEDWLSRSEELVTRESYGYSLKDTEAYAANIQALKKMIPDEGHTFTALLEQGKALLDSMDPHTDAERYMDGKLIQLEQRWTDLVTQDRGTIDVRLTDVDKVLINWKAYTKMRSGTQAFVTQMTKMVGTEPLESSHGDPSLLPTYMTYASQLRNVAKQYNQLMTIGTELADNPHVGGNGAIQHEIEGLKTKFEPLKDNVVDTLELLKREYNEWILVKLRQMSQLVSQADDLTKREVRFVESYPLSTLMETEAAGLLKEAEALVDSLDQVNQMEADCTVIEESLLERQIGHETSSDESLEFSTTLAEKHRLQEERERLLTLSDMLDPILKLFCQQLQLLDKVQVRSKVIAMVTGCVGRKDELESLLIDAKLKLSEDEFESLRTDAYDLGTISEVAGEIMTGSEQQATFTLPTYDKVVEVNRTLTEEVDTLSDRANEAVGHLQLVIEWWSEFNGNHDDVSPWLEAMEEQMTALETQLDSSTSPRPCPLSLRDTATALRDEVEEKSVVIRALSSTGESLVLHMKTEERSHDLHTHINDVVTGTKTRWEELKKKAEFRWNEAKERGDMFESFVDRLSEFAGWLSEFYRSVYDEFCERIPPKASDEIIAHHKSTLKRFFNEAQDHHGDYEGLEAESEKWAEHLIPEEFQENLMSPSEPSPPPFADDSEFPPPSQLSYVKRRTASIFSKWSKLQRLLKERETQLEMSSGSMQEYLEGLQNLLDWIDQELGRDALVAMPPAHAQLLKGYLEQLQVTGTAFTDKRSTKNTVERLAVSLKSQVATELANAIDTRVGELQEKWQSLDERLSERKTVLTPILSQVEAHTSSCSEFGAWLDEQEQRLEECGPIGADLKRLVELNELLKNLDEGLLERKGTAGALQNEAQSFTTTCSSTSLSSLKEQVDNLDTRYLDLNQRSLERQERCEEALAAMQAFQKKVDAFVSWLEGEEKKLEAHKAEKKPIGTILSELENFYDFMSEVEQHTDDYNDLIPESRQLGSEYKPSTALDEMMEQLHERWFKHVEEGLLGRCDKLLGLLDYWQRYEKEVKDLLEWIMDEANKFSKEVTTKGDKGIEDHIESCKVFTETLQNKKADVERIEDLADLLRTEDGEKKNGTSDVESRWNDVNQHWNSLCKLLQETLLRLEATYAEVRHVLLIRTEEFDWLEDCEHMGYLRRPIRGNLDTVQEEIESHEESLTEVEAHANEADFITNTVPFLVEHSRKAVREEIKLRAEEHAQRYDKLRNFLGVYVGNLKDSIPFWQEFNQQTDDLGEWLQHANAELESDRTQPGNATVTEMSLRNTHMLQGEIEGRQDYVDDAMKTGNALKRLVGDEDQRFISEMLERLKFGTQEVEQEAEERVEHLEERYKSWRVFPVEEARAVQEFLSAVEGEMEEEITDEMSADQLLEKLERLEMLQQTQSSREGEVKAIDRSADSEEVKKALKRNPDISKERNNLLQGWTSMSGVLKEKIAAMKKRALMMKAVEDALRSCEEEIKDFKSHLDAPLPSPVLLANQEKELSSTMTQLHNSCRASLNDLQNVFSEYDAPGGRDVQIPPHLLDRGGQLQEEFNQLVAMATERRRLIEDTASSWNEFSTGLDEFYGWLRTASAELSSLKSVEKFADQFTELEERLEVLTADIPEKTQLFDRLRVLSGRHMTSESADIVQVKEQFEKCEKMWTSLKTGVDALPAAMEPWRKVTSQHENLDDVFDKLDRESKDDIEAVASVEDESADICEHIYRLKSHMEKLSTQAPQLRELQRTATQLLTDDLCEKHEPVKTLKEQCEQLEPKWEGLREKIEDKLGELERRHDQWRSDAIESIKKYMEVRLQLDELRDEKDNEIRQLKYHLDHRPRSVPRRATRGCACNGWKVSCIILFVMVLLLVLVLAAVIAIQVVDPEIRAI